LQCASFFSLTWPDRLRRRHHLGELSLHTRFVVGIGLRLFAQPLERLMCPRHGHSGTQRIGASA